MGIPMMPFEAPPHVDDIRARYVHIYVRPFKVNFSVLSLLLFFFG